MQANVLGRPIGKKLELQEFLTGEVFGALTDGHVFAGLMLVQSILGLSLKNRLEADQESDLGRLNNLALINGLYGHETWVAVERFRRGGEETLLLAPDSNRKARRLIQLGLDVIRTLQAEV